MGVGLVVGEEAGFEHGDALEAPFEVDDGIHEVELLRRFRGKTGGSRGGEG